MVNQNWFPGGKVTQLKQLPNSSLKVSEEGRKGQLVLEEKEPLAKVVKQLLKLLKISQASVFSFSFSQ